jgi:hypothetical protein
MYQKAGLTNNRIRNSDSKLSQTLTVVAEFPGGYSIQMWAMLPLSSELICAGWMSKPTHSDKLT